MNQMMLCRVFRAGSWAVVGLFACVFAAHAIDDDFDRLDGTGASRVKVDVVEWEGNLELHFYPKGRLKGIGLKIDRSQKDKAVMVIAYRFTPAPGRVLASESKDAPLIRRAVLGIHLRDDFKVFRDPEPADYDKIVITNHALPAPLVAFHTDAAPKQLYPDGHPMNGDAGKGAVADGKPGKIDLAPKETREVFTRTDGVNPEVREVPRSAEVQRGTMGAPSERGPATAQPSKFQNHRIDENTSGDIKVQEISLDRGFSW